MPLEDLGEYFNEQMKRIGVVVDDGGFGSHGRHWIALRDYFWGKGLEALENEEPVIRDSNPVQSVTLPDRHPVATVAYIFWDLCNKILIRLDYGIAQDRNLPLEPSQKHTKQESIIMHRFRSG